MTPDYTQVLRLESCPLTPEKVATMLAISRIYRRLARKASKAHSALKKARRIETLVARARIKGTERRPDVVKLATAYQEIWEKYRDRLARTALVERDSWDEYWVKHHAYVLASFALRRKQT